MLKVLNYISTRHCYHGSCCPKSSGFSMWNTGSVQKGHSIVDVDIMTTMPFIGRRRLRILSVALGEIELKWTEMTDSCQETHIGTSNVPYSIAENEARLTFKWNASSGINEVWEQVNIVGETICFRFAKLSYCPQCV